MTETNEEAKENPTMGYKEIAYDLRNRFAPLSHKMGEAGNIFWLMMAAEESGAIKLIKKGRDAFSGDYELLVGDMGSVTMKICRYYNSQRG